ncbi:MAG TPA: DUF4190 domain-containing protein [Jatrophihabitantaceae bacterium]|nr:DUF4190 domain-containing protein [Jatrophihabitantaceae bacterium]
MTGWGQDPNQHPQQPGGYQPWSPDPTAQQYPVNTGPQYVQPYAQQQYPQPYQPYQGAPYGYPQQKSNPMGVAGFVCGLLGLVLFWFPFVGLILAVLGVALGAAGMSAGKRQGAATGLAVAGLVLGIIALIPGLFWLIFAINV